MNLQDYERKRQKKNINKREERIRSEINEIKKELLQIEKDITSLKEVTKEVEKLGINSMKYYDIGDRVLFGNYRWDEDGTVHPIEWKILKKEENKVLLLSKYILDVKPYNKKEEKVTWETSSIRRWLNYWFYRTGFNETERKKIEKMLVKAEDNHECRTSAGNDTMDRIFLLSINEVKKLLPTDESRQAKGSEYAEMKGLYAKTEQSIEDDDFCCSIVFIKREAEWHLRSPGIRENKNARVTFEGGINRLGDSVADDCIGVRPVLWINLEK